MPGHLALEAGYAASSWSMGPECSEIKKAMFAPGLRQQQTLKSLLVAQATQLLGYSSRLSSCFSVDDGER